MKHSSKKLSRFLMKHGAFKPLHWTWFAVASSLLICLMVLAIYVEQRRTISKTSEFLDNMRAARIDMSKGFLHLSLAGDPASPFSRDEGVVLMKQALHSFRASFLSAGGDKNYRNSIKTFQQEADHLQQLLPSAVGDGRLNPELAIQMRMSFYRMDRLAESIDHASQRQFRDLRDRSHREFVATISVAILLLAIICTGMYLAMKMQERSLAALNRSLEAEKRHEGLLEETGRIAKVGGWELDVATGKCKWTNAVTLIHDLSLETAVDLERGLKFYTEASRVRIVAALDEAVRLGKSYDLELEIVTAKGNLKWVRSIGHAVKEDGKVVRLHGSFQDITDYKEAERAIRERLILQERLGKITETTPGAIYEFRVDLQGYSFFDYVSPNFEQLVGIKPLNAAVDAQDVFKLCPPDEFEKLWESAMDSAASLEKWQRVFRIKHPSKGWVWLETEAIPNRRRDGTVIWHGMMFDVTERKLLEEQLRQSQKMETVGQLAGGVAHDFNNILTVIQGYATLLQRGVIGSQEAAAELYGAVERASSFTRQLLTFSRKQAMRTGLLELNGVVTDMAKILTRTLGDDIELHLDLTEKSTALLADRGMLEQILLNLAVNARDAMVQGGRLTISTYRCELPKGGGRKVAAPAVCLRVVDTGCGIPEETLPKIFEPFFTTKEINKGTGIGLSTVDGIVRQHEGMITVESEVGEGTSFVIRLPASAETIVQLVDTAIQESAPRGDETILLVDDDASILRMARLALEHFGYKVLEAASGNQALAIYERHPNSVSLLLTDLVMPEGMGGQELAQKLCERTPHLRVVFSSGYSREVAPTNGSCYFLQKPYSVGKLARVVRCCLDGRPMED